MADYMITAKNGRRYHIKAVDDAQARRAEAVINGSIDAGDPDLAKAKMPAGWKVTPPAHPQRPAAPAAKPQSDLASLATNGALFGLNDELAGGVGVAYNALKAPFSRNASLADSGKVYRQWRDREAADQDETRRQHPNLAPIVETAGGFAGLPAESVGAGRGLLNGPRSLWATMKAGAKAGAGYGALSGFGYGRGADGSLGGAALGAGFGTLLGAGLPLAIEGGRRMISPAVNLLKPGNGVGRQVVLKAMRDDGIVPAQAGQAIGDAQSRGVPAMLADAGDNLRGLAGSLGRRPGKARTLVRNAVLERQAGQTERVRGHIVGNLGPVTNVSKQSEALINKGRAAAGPLYDQVYAQEGRTSDEIESLLETPAGKAALNKAKTIAANEREDPEKLGFVLDGEGNVLRLSQTAGPKTLDYVKRGLDDVLEPYRNKITGRLDLDEAGRAIKGVKDKFLAEVDQLHPGYAEARAAFAGPARERDALEMGKRAINASPEEIQRMTQRMTDTQKAQFALGHRSALVDLADKRVDAADKVGALMGTPMKRKALAEVHGGADYDRFVHAMGDERQANETFRAVATGSQTAERHAADAETGDGALLQDLAGAALKGASNGGTTGALARVAQFVKEQNAFGAGKAGQRAREDAAALLTETDPAALRKAIGEAMRQDLLSRIHQRGIYRRETALGAIGGRGFGAIGGYAMQPLADEPY
jgi:hypothetical protein